MKALLLTIGILAISSTALGQRSPVACGDKTLHLQAFSNGHVRTDNISIVWNDGTKEVFGFPTSWRDGEMIYMKLSADQDYVIAFDRRTKEYDLNGQGCQ